MAKYITDTMIIRAHTLLRSSLPMDTGNLRYNATTRTKLGSGFEFNVGGERAPYFEILQDKSWSKHYNTFEKVNFTPVFRYLETSLKGQFAGGRFLQKNGVKVYSAQMARQQFRLEFENTGARNLVASKYGG
jgi:hypothetical protein